MARFVHAVLLAFASVGAVSAQQPSASAVTLAIVNARVWTGNTSRPWADALAIRGERIALVGSSAEVQKLVSRNTRVIDAHGAMVTPGFIDSHVHFMSSSFGLTSVHLRDAATPAEFTRRIKEYASAHPEGWILGGEWDHTLWGGEL